jgi:hypothetical protein
MAANESTLELKFKVSDDGSVVLDKIGKKLSETGENVERMNRSLGIIKIDSIINLGERVFQGAERMYNFARSTSEAANEIEKMAKISGLTLDNWQKLAYAARMADVDIESVSVGIRKLSSNMVDGNTIFERLGISVKTTSGELKPLDAMVMDLADRFAKMEDGAGKVAIATDLFGRSGEKLIPFLNKGSSGIKEFYTEAEKLGVVLGKDVIEAGSKAEDKFKQIDERLQSMKLRFAPIALGFVTMLDDMLRAATIFNENPEMKKWWTPIAPQFGKKQAGEWPSESRFVPKEAAPLIASEAALKAIAVANEKIILQNYKLSDLYDYEANVLKGQTRFLEDREKAMGLLEKLGLRTETGAKKEIEDLVEQYRHLGVLGLKPEEMAGAKSALISQLEAIKEKYSSFSGWMEEEFEEGRVKWIHSVPKDELTRNVESMVNQAIQDLNRMSGQLDEMAMRPNKITIDTSEFASANQAIDTLRIKLENMTERTWPIVISITGKGSSELPIMDKIQQVYDSFNFLPESLRGLAVSISLKGVSDELYALQGQMASLATAASPMGWVPGAWQKYQMGQLQPQIENLMMMQQILQGYKGQATGAAYTGGSGNVSINIGTINVSGGGSAQIAEQLDEKLASLWEKNRSKLKRAIKG